MEKCTQHEIGALTLFSKQQLADVHEASLP